MAPDENEARIAEAARSFDAELHTKAYAETHSDAAQLARLLSFLSPPHGHSKCKCRNVWFANTWQTTVARGKCEAIPPPRRHRHRYHGVLAPVCPKGATRLCAPPSPPGPGNPSHYEKEDAVCRDSMPQRTESASTPPGLRRRIRQRVHPRRVGRPVRRSRVPRSPRRWCPAGRARGAHGTECGLTSAVANFLRR
jgi:hypothetical protein